MLIYLLLQNNIFAETVVEVTQENQKNLYFFKHIRDTLTLPTDADRSTNIYIYIFFLCCGSAMEGLWNCHGSAVEVPWKCRGSAVEVPLTRH